MKDMYNVFKVPDTEDGGCILRQCGKTGKMENMLDDIGLTFHQSISVCCDLIETYDRGYQHALQDMKDYLDRKELNNVRARHESSKDSDDDTSILLIRPSIP